MAAQPTACIRAIIIGSVAAALTVPVLALLLLSAVVHHVQLLPCSPAKLQGRSKLQQLQALEQPRRSGVHHKAGRRGAALADMLAVRPMSLRTDLAARLQQEGFKSGIELGVAEGWFSRHNLQFWPACEQYHLVDLWAHQANYTDLSNVEQTTQDQFLDRTRAAVEPWKHKVVEHRMSTLAAAPSFANASVDFVYVDARHDYCGVAEDLTAYWPKLRAGGIMAGHDYLDAAQCRAMTPDQDWNLCRDGRVVPGAVRQAVDEFVAEHDLILTTTTKEAWPTWFVRKPLWLP